MGKELQSIVFFVKKVQFRMKTLKNSIEIAVAYAHPLKIIDRFFRKVKNSLKIVFIGLFLIGCGVLVVYNKDIIFKLFNDGSGLNQQLSDTLVSIETKNIPKVDSLSKSKDKSPLPVIFQTDVESTLYQQPKVILKKPIIHKYVLERAYDSLSCFYIVANKAFKTMYLLQNQKSEWKTVKEFDIAIGAQDGQKIHAGDKRTPEGQYFIVGRREATELSSIYGPLAYVLDYPNEEDKKAGRTGQGIWIHGTSPDSMPVDTKGCLEMKNEDLKELSGFLKRGVGVPVLIVNDTVIKEPDKYPDFVESGKKRSIILASYSKTKSVYDSFLVAWKIAWETKNFPVYASFYDTILFKGQGLDWNGWRERKLHTFDLYDTISISIDSVLITDYSEQTTVVKFFQHYKTNLNQNENAKKLILEKVNDVWKITSESTCLKEELLL